MMQVQEPSKKLAISYGEPLASEVNAPIRLAGILERAAQTDKNLVYVQSDGAQLSQSYQDLWQDAQRILAGLRKLGIKPQDKIIFQIDNSQDYVPAFWGCILGGFIPVPISISPTYREVNSTLNKLYHAWQMLENPLVLTTTRLADDIRSLSGLLNIENFSVETVDHVKANDPDETIHLSDPDDLTLLLLTSGSTGLPKAVMLTHKNLLSMLNGTGQKFNFSSQEVILNWMPLDHVGAIVCLMLMAVNFRCKQVHVPTEYILQNPVRWLDLIDQHKASISWAPNFAFALMNDRAEEIRKHSWNLSSMNFLINAGEQIATKTIRTCLKLLQPHGLPSHATRPAFGMSETCSGISFSEGFSLENSSDDMPFVELGPPICGSALRIADDEDHVLPEREVGRLQVKGPSVTSGYYKNPEKNKEVFSADGWFNTGDLGYLENGRLVLTGREKDDIIINGVNYYSHEIEAVVEELDEIETSYTAACPVRNANSKTDQLAVFFHASVTEHDDLKSLMKKIRGTVAKKIGVNPEYMIPVEKKRIPKTAIGKIQRPQLSQQFEEGAFDTILLQFGIDREKVARKGEDQQVRQVVESGQGATILEELEKGAAAWLYQPVWESRERVSFEKSIEKQTGRWFVFTDQTGVGQQLIEKLKQNGNDCIVVSAGQSYQKLDSKNYCINPANSADFVQLFQELLEEKCRGIVHLWSLDQKSESVDFELSQKLGWESVLYLVQALVQSDESDLPFLSIVTRGSQAVLPDDTLPQPHSACLWGLGKVIPLEHSKLLCRLIDLDDSKEQEGSQFLLEEMHSSDGENQVAFRHGKRHIARLTSHSKTEVTQEQVLHDDGSYLIAGGCRGLGLLVAQWLADQGAKHLILVGRSGASNNTQAVVEQLEQKGVKILVIQADIGDYQNAVQMMTEVKKTMPSLRGIFNTAGVVDDSTLLEENRNHFNQVLFPKVQGSWHLHTLTQDIPLDFFVGFSSIASLFGAEAKASYAAANAFMDALMYHRCSKGLPGLSINWGPWAEAGMVANDERIQKRWAAQGLGSIPSKKGLDALQLLLQGKFAQVAVMPVVWGPFLQKFLGLNQLPFLEAFEHELSDTSAGTTIPILKQLEQASARERRTQLAAHICDQVAALLNLESTEQIELQESLFDLGVDSLTVVELRDRFESSLGCSLPSTLLFDYPTVDSLVEYFATEVIEMDMPASDDNLVNTEETVSPSSDDELQDLTEDELGSLLDTKLSNIEKNMGS